MPDVIKDWENDLQNLKDDFKKDELINKIYNRMIKTYIVIDSEGNVSVREGISDDHYEMMKKYAESELMVLWFKESLGKFENLYNEVSAIILDVNSEKARENARRIAVKMKEFILDKDKRAEIQSINEAVNYDDIIIGYIDLCRKLNEPIDDDFYESIKDFYDNLPEGVYFQRTKFYEKYWLPEHQTNEKIYSVHSKKTKQEYLDMIHKYEVDRNGKIDNFEDFDFLLDEYLFFYGDEISYEEAEKYFHIIDENIINGGILYTESSKFFKNTSIGNEVLRNNPQIVFNDILRSSTYSSTFVDNLENDVYIETLNHMVSENPDTGRAYVEDYLASLSDHGKIGIRITDSLINLIRSTTYRGDSAPKTQKLLTWALSINIYESLLKNFDEGKLDNKNIDENGLTNFDYADIALSLICKSDLENGIKEVNDENKKLIYEKYGRDLYDSRGIRTLVTRYIDEFRNKSVGTNDELEKICLDFVRNVSRKTNFDLFKDQECSDIIQLAKTGRYSFAKKLEEEIRKGINENPAYNMSLKDAETYVYTFLQKIGEKVIDESFEIEFERFLKALSIMRLNDENGLIPQEISEFLIRQAMNKMSIVNSNGKKYASVFERVIENYALNDALGDGAPISKVPLYFTRELLVDEATQGLKGPDFIASKRAAVHSILEGKMNALDTIFHENTHYAQERRMSKFAVESLKDYMMIKELIISLKKRSYYDNNYHYIYSEIDARENAAKKVLGFVDKVLRTKLTVKIANGIRKDVVDMFEKSYDEIIHSYSCVLEEEARNYKYALNKKGESSKLKSVHFHFESILERFDIAMAIQRFPALFCEYTQFGKRRTISDQLDFINGQRKNLKLPVMAELLVNTRDYREGLGNSDNKFYLAIDRLINSAQTEEEKDFVNVVISQILPSETKHFWSKKRVESFISPENSYEAYLGIVTLLRKAEIDKSLDVFNVPGKDGRTPKEILYETKETFDKKFPEFSKKAEKEVEGYVKQYIELGKIAADVIGKKAALDMENKEEKRLEDNVEY